MDTEVIFVSILAAVGGRILIPGVPPIFSEISQFLGSLANSFTNTLSIERPELDSGVGQDSEARYLTESIVIKPVSYTHLTLPTKA